MEVARPIDPVWAANVRRGCELVILLLRSWLRSTLGSPAGGDLEGVVNISCAKCLEYRPLSFTVSTLVAVTKQNVKKAARLQEEAEVMKEQAGRLRQFI